MIAIIHPTSYQLIIMKRFISILSLRLTKDEKEAIDLIVKEEERISSGTSTGAVRQMIMCWRPLIEELREAKAECLALSQQNMKYSKAIGEHCRSLEEMQSLQKQDLYQSVTSQGNRRTE